MRGGWCGGSRTSCASGRGSRENAERGSRNAERPDTLLAAARPFPDVPRSTFRVPRSPGPPICRPRRSARPLRPLAHPPHAPFPRSFPPGIPGRRRGGRPGGRACVPAARVELHPPRQVVDLTLVDDIDAANGATLVFPSDPIYLFLPPPATEPGLQHYDSWLRLVTTHELTHVFHLDRVRGVWGGVQAVFGRVPGLFPNDYQPSWVTEGLAVYYESKFTNGGRVTGSLHTQLLAADRAAGASRSPWNAVFFTRWADGLVPYAYGSRFFHYLAGQTGDSVVPRFVEATSAQLIPYRVGRQIARADPGRSLEAEWPKGTGPPPQAGAA